MNEPTDDDLRALIERASARYAASGQGQLDEERLAAALAQVLDLHRSHGSPIDELGAYGASCFVVPPTSEDAARVEVRLGWPDDDRVAPKIRGRTVHLAYLQLSEITRGPAA